MFEKKLWFGELCQAVGNSGVGFHVAVAEVERTQREIKQIMTENEIATLALDICFKIHRQYGPGLFESVYEEIFCHEWAKTGISFKRQQGVPLIHEDVRMEIGFRADVILGDKVILEIKSIETLADIHFKQVLTYLKLTNLKLGLIVNFNVVLLKDGIKRVANNV